MDPKQVYDFIYGNRIMTTGKIIFMKPWYIRDKRGETSRIGYKLSIRTPHRIKVKGMNIPIYLTVFGKSDNWHAYKVFIKKGERISVSGERSVTRFYENDYKTKKSTVKKRGIWVILKRKPRPSMVPLQMKTLSEVIR